MWNLYTLIFTTFINRKCVLLLQLPWGASVYFLYLRFNSSVCWGSVSLYVSSFTLKKVVLVTVGILLECHCINEASTRLYLTTLVSSFVVNLTDLVTLLLVCTTYLQLMQLICKLFYEMPYCAIFHQNRSNGFWDITFFDFSRRWPLQSWIIKFSTIFVCWGLDGIDTLLCQISPKSVISLWKYSDFSVFQIGGCRHLRF